MADSCSVCARPDRAEVDAALAAGEGVNATADRFAVSRTTLKRHAKHRDIKPASVPAPPPEAPAEALLSVFEATQQERKRITRDRDEPEILDMVAEQAEREGRRNPQARGVAVELRRSATDLRVERLCDLAEAFLEDARAVGEDGPDHSGRARLVQAFNATLTTLAKLRGELRTEVDLRVVMASPHMIAVLEAHRRALRAYPEARAAVAVELDALEANQAPRLVTPS